MSTVRTDRLVRVLTAIASAAYFALWAAAAAALIALPAVRMFGVTSDKFYYSLELPVAAPGLEAVVHTDWAPAPIKVVEMRGQLQLPIPMLPWSLIAVLWIYAAAASALMLLVLHNLRRIFQRVRDGAAFDAQNAVRLRTLSALLLALLVLKAVAEVATSLAVRRGLAAGSSLAVPPGLHIDMTLVLVALVLVALAEIFRRGADLEDDQSLVI